MGSRSPSRMSSWLGPPVPERPRRHRKKAGCSLTIADATTLTEAGYVGEDVENMISNLLIAADNDVQKAERGIIYTMKSTACAQQKAFITRDVSGEGVQQACSKLLRVCRE